MRGAPEIQDEHYGRFRPSCRCSKRWVTSCLRFSRARFGSRTVCESEAGRPAIKTILCPRSVTGNNSATRPITSGWQVYPIIFIRIISIRRRRRNRSCDSLSTKQQRFSPVGLILNIFMLRKNRKKWIDFKRYANDLAPAYKRIRFAFHGTSSVSADQIAKGGFDPMKTGGIGITRSRGGFGPTG